MGHLGLTPQSIHKFGSYRTRGTTDEEADQIATGSGSLHAGTVIKIGYKDAMPADEPPDLARVLGQLAQPRTVIESLHSPALPMRMEYRVPVTARTAGAAGEDASYLFLAA